MEAIPLIASSQVLATLKYSGFSPEEIPEAIRVIHAFAVIHKRIPEMKLYLPWVFPD
jgi:hypothetical protein